MGWRFRRARESASRASGAWHAPFLLGRLGLLIIHALNRGSDVLPVHHRLNRRCGRGGARHRVHPESADSSLPTDSRHARGAARNDERYRRYRRASRVVRCDVRVSSAARTEDPAFDVGALSRRSLCAPMELPPCFPSRLSAPDSCVWFRDLKSDEIDAGPGVAWGKDGTNTFITVWGDFIFRKFSCNETHT